jgi:hypothetical protein
VPQPTPTAAERFATILLWLCRAVAARSATGLPGPLIVLIVGRISHINQRIARLAARIRAGRYAARSAPRRSPIFRRPRRPNPLPQEFGWLLKRVPEAAGYRSQFEYLLRDAEMAALLAAAPTLARPLRSLCWMLRVSPPPILASPQPAPPQAAPAAAPRASPPRPPPPPSPAPCHTAFAPQPPPARACGPPLQRA